MRVRDRQPLDESPLPDDLPDVFAPFVAELSDHLGVAEIAGGRISCPAEGDRANISRLA